MDWRHAPKGHPDRETAREIADFYRRAMAAPGGIYRHHEKGVCLEIQADPELLLRMLENFAQHGTFFPKALVEKEIDKEQLRQEFEKEVRLGATQDEALELISDDYKTRGKGYSRSSIERKIGKRKTSKS